MAFLPLVDRHDDRMRPFSRMVRSCAEAFLFPQKVYHRGARKDHGCSKNGNTALTDVDMPASNELLWTSTTGASLSRPRRVPFEARDHENRAYCQIQKCSERPHQDRLSVDAQKELVKTEPFG